MSTPSRKQIVDLAKEFTDDCVANNRDLLPYVGTNSSARDMDSIRRALGEATISYFGFSYGSELGAVWATMFPDTVRAAVLDGAADPNADMETATLQQAAGFEHTFDTFLDWCDTDASCTFGDGGSAADAFDALMQRLDESPVPSREGRPDVNLSVAITAVAQAMYSDTLWPRLGTALTDQGRALREVDVVRQHHQAARHRLGGARHRGALGRSLARRAGRLRPDAGPTRAAQE